MGIAKITRNFQVTLPKDVREIEQLHEGDRVLFLVEQDKIIVKKLDEDIIKKTAGLWSGMKETGVQYTRRLRKEWVKREARWS